MRDILFRGKRLDNGEWTQGDLLQLFDGRRYIVANRFGACIDSHGNFINTEAPFVNEVDPATIGQYTGMKDKNGKRIFEGDIFEWGYAGVKDFRYVVGYAADVAAFVGNRHFGFVSLNGIDIEIIGNAHDLGTIES